MRQKTLKRKRTFVQSFPLLAIALPGLVYLFINNYIPMAGIFIAFKKINYAKGIFKSPWCGLENFKFLFQSNSTFIMLRNTVLYNLLFIFLGTILAVALAIFMSEISRSRMSKFFQAGLVLPNLISMVFFNMFMPF